MFSIGPTQVIELFELDEFIDDEPFIIIDEFIDMDEFIMSLAMAKTPTWDWLPAAKGIKGSDRALCALPRLQLTEGDERGVVQHRAVDLVRGRVGHAVVAVARDVVDISVVDVVLEELGNVGRVAANVRRELGEGLQGGTSEALELKSPTRGGGPPGTEGGAASGVGGLPMTFETYLVGGRKDGLVAVCSGRVSQRGTWCEASMPTYS